jgi:hypothetical protein
MAPSPARYAAVTMSSTLTQSGEGNGWATAPAAATAQAGVTSTLTGRNRAKRSGCTQSGLCPLVKRMKRTGAQRRRPEMRLSRSVEILEVALDFAEHGYVAVVFRGPLLELRRLRLAVEQLKPKIELGQ